MCFWLSNSVASFILKILSNQDFFYFTWLLLINNYIIQHNKNLNVWQKKLVALERVVKNVVIGAGRTAEPVLLKAHYASLTQNHLINNRAGFIRGFSRLKTQLKNVSEKILSPFILILITVQKFLGQFLGLSYLRFSSLIVR